MKTKITAILIFILIAFAALPVYYIYRSAYQEKNYIELLGAKTSALKPVAEKLNSGQSTESEKLKRLFNELVSRDSSIAAIAVTDRMDRLRFMAKNDAILNSGRVVDDLVSDIRDKKLSAADDKTPVIKNYSGTDWITDKLYIYRFSSGGQSTIAVYSFSVDRLTAIRLALEIILLLSGIIILTSGIIMLLRKNGIIKDSEEYRIKTIIIGEKAPKAAKSVSGSDKKEGAHLHKEKKISEKKNVSSAVQIDESELSVLSDDERGNNKRHPDSGKGDRTYTQDLITQKVFALFKSIHKNMSPESIALYIKTTEEKLLKSYELKGKSIIRIDSLTFNSIDISAIEKINKPGTYITAAGDSVKIPLIHEGNITGLIDIIPGQNASKINIELEQWQITDMAREINNYITQNDLIIDSATGFYSSRYFLNRVTESIQETLNEGREFTLLMINIFAGVDTDRKQKDMILKFIHPELRKAAGPKNKVFLYKDCVSMVLHSTEKECSSIETALVKEISRFRLKVSDDVILKMNPQSIMRYSADSRDLNNILHEVEALAAVSN